MVFEKLEEIVTIDVDYVTKSALAISAGEQPAEVMESPVIKLGGKPVIPGSSLKGAIRSTMEAMLAEAGVEVCIPFAAIPRRHRRKEEQRKYVAKLGRLLPCDDADAPCPVCAIFGTVGGRTGLSGRAIVLDAKVMGDYDLIERTHVAITRDTKAQSDGSLMSLEAVDAGATFNGQIRVVNPEGWQVGALVEALEGVSLLGMGAKKTAGYGELDVNIKGAQITRFVDGEWKTEDTDLEPYVAAFAKKHRK